MSVRPNEDQPAGHIEQPDEQEYVAEQQLLEAAAAGDGAAVARLLEAGAEPACETEEGITPLMLAANAGSAEAVQALLEAGAPWHAQDRQGHTAGDYASGSGRRDIVRQLLDWAVKAELILGTISRRENKGAVPNRDYLGSSIQYKDGKLIDEQGEGVMMDWETPLMRRHAEIICASGGDVLNVGFGMGIIDGFIQEHKPRSHTIIEAHPDVYKFACSQGWDKRPGVRLVLGRWQDGIDQLGTFHGVCFDTYGEYYEDMHDFHLKLPKPVRPGGIYSFFNASLAGQRMGQLALSLRHRGFNPATVQPGSVGRDSRCKFIGHRECRRRAAEGHGADGKQRGFCPLHLLPQQEALAQGQQASLQVCQTSREAAVPARSSSTAGHGSKRLERQLGPIGFSVLLRSPIGSTGWRRLEIEIDGEQHFFKHAISPQQQPAVEARTDEAAWAAGRCLLRLHCKDKRSWPAKSNAAIKLATQPCPSKFLHYTRSYSKPNREAVA